MSNDQEPEKLLAKAKKRKAAKLEEILSKANKTRVSTPFSHFRSPCDS